jgi:hypothetical protein
MRSMRTLLAALLGIALPIGLVLAVYLSSASTIAANPVSLPASALAKGNPAALKDDSSARSERHEKRHRHRGHQGTAPSGTTTDDRGGSSGSGDSGSASTSGSDDHSGSGSSGGSDDSGGDD